MEFADRLLHTTSREGINNHVSFQHQRLATGHDRSKRRRDIQLPTAQSRSCSLNLEHDLRRRREGSFREDV